MTTVVLAVGVAIGALGLLFFASPASFRRSLAFWRVGGRLHGAVALRVALGALLLGGASGTRWPEAVLAVGVLFLLSGVVAALLGIERMRALAGWWQEQGDGMVRLWALLALCFGALLAYAARGGW